MANDESEAEKYYRHKNAARRRRKIARGAATTACCGIPCLVTTFLVLAVASGAALLVGWL